MSVSDDAVGGELGHVDVTNPTRLLKTLPIDHSVPPGDEEGGETAAHDLHWSMATVSHIERGHTSNRAAILTYRDYLATQQPPG